MRRVFGFGGPARNLAARYNIAPTQQAPVVRPDGQGGRELAMPRWGLVPSWAKDIDIGNRTINARAETVSEKPSFRAAFARRRCLVPATGFYEWQKTDGPKAPWNIARPDGETFAFAGLWEHWQGDPAGPPVESFTIVTTEANEALRPIHHRMPVILAPEDWSAWLDVGGTPAGTALALLHPAPKDSLVAWRVGTRVNAPRNDDAACLEPVNEPAPAPAPAPTLFG